MKIKPEHFEHMRTAIAPLDTAYWRERYAAGDFQRADRCKDVNKRYRWDLFSAAGLARYACDTLYSYLDDAHIDTALRAIVKPLTGV